METLTVEILEYGEKTEKWGKWDTLYDLEYG